MGTAPGGVEPPSRRATGPVCSIYCLQAGPILLLDCMTGRAGLRPYAYLRRINGLQANSTCKHLIDRD